MVDRWSSAFALQSLRRGIRSGLVALGVLAGSLATLAVVSPAAGATSLGYACSAPGGWAALHNPENGVDTMVRDALVSALNGADLPVTLNYTGPTTGFQGQSITRTWAMNASLDIPNSQTFDLTLEMDPGLGASTVTASNATPATSSVVIPDMPIVSHVIPIGGTANYAFPATLSSTAVLSGGTADFTPGTFTLPMMVRILFFGEWYGVTGTMVCNPTTTPTIGSVNVDTADGGFHGMSPKRLLDTRSSSCVSGSAGRNLTVTGLAGVPSTAAAVAINVTATRSTSGGYVTVSPTGVTRPTASTLNYSTGATVANLAIAKVGTSGRVNLYASAGCPHLIVDIVGWYEGGTPATGGFAGLTPARLLDTRSSSCVSGSAGRNLTVTGVGGVPAGAGAVALVLTATRATATGYVTVSPTGSARPHASSLNFGKGSTVAITVLAKIGTGGSINLYANNGCPDLLVDVVGWFESSAAANGGFASQTPTRILDTRTSPPCVSGSAGRNLTVTGVAGVPSNASSVALNVTAVGATTSGYVTVSPTGTTRPVASNLNFLKSSATAAMVIAKVGTGGKINLYANAGCPNIIVDVVGYFTATPF